MGSPSGPRRPFYTEYAWAFDLLIDRPVRKECGTIAAWLVERGVMPAQRCLTRAAERDDMSTMTCSVRTTRPLSRDPRIDPSTSQTTRKGPCNA
jgi:hypothetical protein